MLPQLGFIDKSAVNLADARPLGRRMQYGAALNLTTIKDAYE